MLARPRAAGGSAAELTWRGGWWRSVRLETATKRQGILARSAAALLAAAAALPGSADLAAELECVETAVRARLFPAGRGRSHSATIRAVSRPAGGDAGNSGGTGGAAGRGRMEWRDRLPVFAAAFAASCVLVRADRFLVELAAERPVVWKKLDEEDLRTGIPRKTFTGIYKAAFRSGESGAFSVGGGFPPETSR